MFAICRAGVRWKSHVERKIRNEFSAELFSILVLVWDTWKTQFEDKYSQILSGGGNGRLCRVQEKKGEWGVQQVINLSQLLVENERRKGSGASSRSTISNVWWKSFNGTWKKLQQTFCLKCWWKMLKVGQTSFGCLYSKSHQTNTFFNSLTTHLTQEYTWSDKNFL